MIRKAAYGLHGAKPADGAAKRISGRETAQRGESGWVQRGIVGRSGAENATESDDLEDGGVQ